MFKMHNNELLNLYSASNVIMVRRGRGIPTCKVVVMYKILVRNPLGRHTFKLEV
jgi:hypothetical protein